MTIDDVIRYFKDMEKACCCGTEQATIAIDTMRKYQKIQEIVKNTQQDTRNLYDGRVRRKRKCLDCGKVFTTYEVYIADGEQLVPNLFRENGVKVVWK